MWPFTKKVKKVAFIDGDQGINACVEVYFNHLRGVETHVVRCGGKGDFVPKRFKDFPNEVNKVFLSGYQVRKEITDKYITACIQRCLDNGYRDITVVSADYDFVDIFRLTIELNPELVGLTFRIIVPAKCVTKKGFFDNPLREECGNMIELIKG